MFYDDLKKELTNLVAEQKFDEALKIVNEELNAPYIPQDFENYLLTLKREILLIINEKDFPDFSLHLSLETIKKKLFSARLTDQAAAIQALKNINVRPILFEIEKYLLNPDFPSDNKTLILLVLEDQQISEKIKLQKGEKIFEVVPTKLESELLFATFKKVQILIQEVIGEKNPTLINNAQSLTLLFLMSRFPEIQDFAINDLAAAIIKNTYESLGLSLTWAELTLKLLFNLQKAQELYQEQKNQAIVH